MKFQQWREIETTNKTLYDLNNVVIWNSSFYKPF